MKTKLVLLVCAMLAAVAVAADKDAKIPKNKWFLNGKGYQEALDLQKQTGANLLVYFEKNFPADEKGLCNWWEKKGLIQPDVQKVVEQLIKVKFTFPLSRDDQALADKWKINKCPVIMVVQTNGWRERVQVFDWTGNQPRLKQVRDIVQGFQDASEPHAFKGRNAAPAAGGGEPPAEEKK
jgi:hypothetical protein